MSSLVITVQSDRPDGAELVRGTPSEGLLELARLFKAAAMGNEECSVDVQTSTANPVAASGTLTLASMADSETCVIGNTTLTAASSPSGESQFEIDGTDTADATALVNCINAHSVLSLIVSASSSAGVVTITALSKGTIGNHIKLTGDTGCTASGAYLSGGTGGASDSATTYGAGL